jgi:hypothetical protein
MGILADMYRRVCELSELPVRRAIEKGLMKKEHLPGHVVTPPPPESGCKVIHGTYTASTGLEIPVEIHAHPGGLIERLWREEQARRNQITLKIAKVDKLPDSPRAVLFDAPPKELGLEEKS